MVGLVKPLVEDDVLSALYCGHNDALPFQRFLRALGRRLGVVLAGIDIGIGEEGIEPTAIFYYPVDSAKEVLLHQAHQQYWQQYPRPDNLQPGDIYQLHEIASDSWQDSPYYRQLMLPFQIHTEWVMVLSGPDNVVCLLRLGVTEKALLTPAHRAFLQQLRPYIEQALTLHKLIRRPQSIVDSLAAMSDALAIGFFILNGHGQVIQSNLAAENIVHHNKHLSLVDNCLKLARQSGYQKQFSAFIQQALDWRTEDMQRCNRLGVEQYLAQAGTIKVPAYVLRIQPDSASATTLLIQPLRPSLAYRNETGAQLIVHLVDSAHDIFTAEKLVGDLYGLTPAEARLANLLANGYSIVEAANTLGLTEGSARTSTKRIYGKTGVSGQAQLVQLLLQSVARLGQ